MKNTILRLAVILISVCGIFGQNKTISADEVVKQIKLGKVTAFEDVTVIGDLDLTNLPNQTNDAVYTEKGKTVKVFSNNISQTVSFKNVKFADKLNLFRKESDAKEIREYRVVFEKTAVFENCIFEKEVNFELTNFRNETSFANSVFKQKPLLVRVGLEKIPNLNGTSFEQGSVFQFTQNDKQMNFSTTDLQTLLKRLAVR